MRSGSIPHASRFTPVRGGSRGVTGSHRVRPIRRRLSGQHRTAPVTIRPMSLAEDFAAAQTRVKKLARTPSNDELLDLYSLYKQASVGDVQGTRPGMLDFKGRAKYDAW